MLRVALYARVSTEEQKLHGLSVEAQQKALEDWAKQEQHKVVGRYIDNGISARKKAAHRPALQQLLSDVRAGKVDLVVFTKLDRWFRNVGEYYKVQEVLDDHKVAWKTIHEDYDTTTSAGRLKVNIMLSVAQDEADRTSERIKKVFELKRSKGEPVSGQVPTGYIIQGKTIQKDPATMEAVAAYFGRYMASGSLSDAIDYVAERYGLRLQYQLASKMLSKPAYWGDFNGIECPAYITREQAEHIAVSRRHTSRKTKNNRVYTFTGLLFCAECGARMGARTHNIAGIEKAEYNCPGHYQKKGCGNRTNIRQAHIEDFLLTTVDERFKAYRDTYYGSSGKKAASSAPEIAKIKRKLSKLKELYLNDLISMEEYKTDHERMIARLIELEAAQKQDKRATIEALSKLLCAGWQDVYAGLNPIERKAFWRMVLSNIRIYVDRHIDYNFL